MYLREMDGVNVIKPKGSPHELVVLEGNLIYPFRFAKDGSVPIQKARVTEKKISRLVADLFASYGPEPRQPPLFPPGDDTKGDSKEAEFAPMLTTLPKDTRLVLLAYASNERSGVINAWLGEGELGPKGHVHWLPGKYEQLPLEWPDSGGSESHGPLAPIPGPQLTGPVGQAATPAVGPRFDDGDMPAVPLTARAPVERENSEMYPPVTERAPQEPKADDEVR
jgi:hypothetical protein